MLAVSLRDPLRDTLEFRKFAWGVAVSAALLLLLPLFRPFHYQNLGRLIVHTAALARFALFALLLLARRLRSHRQRRQSEPRAIPACRNQSKSCWYLFLAGYFSHESGNGCASFATKPLLPRLAALDRSAASV